MNLKRVYLILCIAGTVLPYSQFIPWLAANGLNLTLLFEQVFANRISAFFGMDVFVSALALLIFARTESLRLKIRGWWIVVPALFLVGVSLALPLFLYMREGQAGGESSAKRVTV